MSRKFWKKAVVFLGLSILLEMLVFNYRALFSMSASNQQLEFVREGSSVYAADMEGEPGYLYVGVEAYTENGGAAPVTLKISIQDEGNKNYYELQELTIYPMVEKSKYLRINSYGGVKGIQIALEPATSADIYVSDVIYDAKVPWFVSAPRLLLVFFVFCLGWLLRPASGIYSLQWKAWQKRMAVGVLLLISSVFFLFLVRSNPAFLNPVWPYHQQYHQLAVSLSRGKVSIDVGSDETVAALAALDNPYDYDTRMQTVPDAEGIWDICYYGGKFYVYFGIVPVLVFYLPYYLIFHGAFPTWLGVFLAGTGILCGVYFMLGHVRKRWFPNTPYMWYLLLAAVSGNSLNLFCAMLHADFYYLPILMALCFTVWGLGWILSAADHWEQEKKHVAPRMAAGGLCMALTAGCRPQFLVGSFLLPFILGTLFLKNRKSKKTLLYLAALAVPYLVVAIGLMYYNKIRFGSVFDFGAAYNLTTNDMTRRGMNLGRLPDGIFMYLFQPVSMRLSFPFAEVTPFYSDYLGKTIRDWTFGGVFWTHPVLLGLFGLAGGVKRELKRKKIYGFTLFSAGLALAVVAVDTELAGILNRYNTDFLWLLIIPTVIVLFQMLEKYQNTGCFKWILWFVLIAGAWGIFYELGMAFRGCGLINDNAHRYYMIKALFQ